MDSYRTIALLAVSLCAVACGGPAVGVPPPASRPSGQSRLIEQTFAGQNTCNPKNHDRPFVIEWDATDASSFEARTATDVVFVRYEGCNLQIIDTCTNDSVRGSFGSYLPVDWTSGALEKVDIANEGELFAKLPLGVGSLGGRVRAGEQFHMEYFVSGTRRATRPYVYRGEIDKIPGCRGVTHVVYAYNLGAFALGSAAKLHAGVGATVWGVGAGANATSMTAAEKRGGLLTSCRPETAKDSDACRAPIRLTLREIQEGDSPDAKAAVAPETPDALNLAGKIQATNEHERKAAELATSAQSKLMAGDAVGCLRDLDEHDRLDARPMASSTSAKGVYAFMRSQCLMASGKCEAGKALARKYWQASAGANAASEGIDRTIDAFVAQYCRGADAKPRDRFLHAMYALSDRQHKVDAAECRAQIDIVRRVAPSLSREERGGELKDIDYRLADDAPRCLARAGDCVGAFRVARETWAALEKEQATRFNAWHVRERYTSATGELCFSKPEGELTRTEEVARAAADLQRSKQTSISAATCRSVYQSGRKALFSKPLAGDDELGRLAGELRDGATECFGRAGECASSWQAFAEIYRYKESNATDARVREAFDRESYAARCHQKPQGALSTNEKIFYLSSGLERGEHLDKTQCLAMYNEARKLFSQVPVSKRQNDDVERARDDLGMNAARCLVRAKACDEAWRVFEPEESARIARRFTNPGKQDIEQHFKGRFRSECPR